MIGDSRNKTDAVAIASLGVALSILLAGICWIAAQDGGERTHLTIQRCVLHAEDCRPEISIENDPAAIPTELWIVLGLLGVAFVGTLLLSQYRKHGY